MPISQREKSFNRHLGLGQKRKNELKWKKIVKTHKIIKMAQ